MLLLYVVTGSEAKRGRSGSALRASRLRGEQRVIALWTAAIANANFRPSLWEHYDARYEQAAGAQENPEPRDHGS
jgi:hypothetical protein